MKNMLKKYLKKWSIAIRIIPILLLIWFLKYFSHKYWFEVIAFNALFTSLVAWTIFLLWFLISWVLSDYKESEKIPGDLAACLETIYDTIYCISKSKIWSSASKEFLVFYKEFTLELDEWFYKKIKTHEIVNKLSLINDYFIKLDQEWVQSWLIVRMQNEQNNLRKIILRIHTIRDTNFIDSAYAIVESLSFFIAVWLIIMKIDPLYDWILFTLMVMFLILYMFFLISDLDNPFDYSNQWEWWNEISLKPYRDFKNKLLN